MNQYNGCLITFEGTEGSGKSTQIERIAKKITNQGRDVLKLREPGGTLIGEKIRELIKDPTIGYGMCPETELLLFAASRAQLVRQVILPEIQKGTIVLCDRFFDSTTVYQGLARKIPQDVVAYINKFVLGSVFPSLTVVLDIPADIGFSRIKKRNEVDRMEQENISFYESVRKGYLVLAQKEKSRFIVVDACNEPDTIESIIWNAIEKRFIS